MIVAGDDLLLDEDAFLRLELLNRLTARGLRQTRIKVEAISALSP
jgi:hypothetical protein